MGRPRAAGYHPHICFRHCRPAVRQRLFPIPPKLCFFAAYQNNNYEQKNNFIVYCIFRDNVKQNGLCTGAVFYSDWYQRR